MRIKQIQVLFIVLNSKLSATEEMGLFSDYEVDCETKIFSWYKEEHHG